jgi:predicted nucleotidyltransferase
MGVGAGRGPGLQTPKIDIGPRDKEILFSLIKRYLPDTAVCAYGSRVSGNAEPWSDLDLVVFSGAEQKLQVSLLKEALEESSLSFRVDLLEWHSLPDSFRANIEDSCIPLTEINF